MAERGPTDDISQIHRTGIIPAQTTAGSSGEPHQRPAGLFSKLKSLIGGRRIEASSLMDTLAGETIDGLTVNAPRTRREMIERVIAFDEMRVNEVMIPRADIFAVDEATPLRALLNEFSEAGHSRMPVFRDDLDNPQGMVHIKDLVSLMANAPDGADLIAEDASGETPTLKSITRKVLYVPPSMRVVDLFLRMQASRIHMALVIDEYGGTDGLVTIEDLIEEVVGEINDEHDEDESPLVRERKAGGWEADARVELEELETITGLTLQADDEDIDTLGGLVFSLGGRIPVRGEIMTHPSGLEIEVTDADERRIRKLHIKRSSTRPAASVSEPMPVAATAPMGRQADNDDSNPQKAVSTPLS
ncbi:MAG: hemolysin family protein [Pseudomonadota bacterium]